MIKSDFQLAEEHIERMASKALLEMVSGEDVALKIEWGIMDPLGIGGSVTSQRGLDMADRIERRILRELKKRADRIEAAMHVTAQLTRP